MTMKHLHEGQSVYLESPQVLVFILEIILFQNIEHSPDKGQLFYFGEEKRLKNLFKKDKKIQTNP